ncbi:MAG: glycosyltransferase [Flavobacteriales bacterium]|nr:glycosyltransferase [Flavobacteriales bacterium]
MNEEAREHIVIVGPAYPLRGGIANFNEAFAKALKKEDYVVKIFSFYYQYPNFLFPGKSQYENNENAPNLEIINSLGSIQPWSWSKTAKLIAKENPKVVFIRFWLPFMGPSLGNLAKRLRRKGIKVIGITDNVIPHEKRPGDRPLTKYFLKNCDGFITMSNSVLEDISMFTENPQKVMLPHPVYDTFGPSCTREVGIKRLDLESDKKYLLFFGLIREYKGLDLAIEALAKVDDPNVELIIAGEFYEKKEKYTLLIDQLQLQNRIKLFDFYIPTDDVKFYFSVADAVVQPYKSATQSGITQVAYHFEVPMIVSNVGGLPEIVPHGLAGMVVPPNADEFASAINLFYSKNLKDRYVEGVRSEKKRYEWDYFVNEAMYFTKQVR